MTQKSTGTRGSRAIEKRKDQAAPKKMELAYQTDALMQHGVFPKEFVIYYPTPPHPDGGGESEGAVDIGTTRVFINAMTLLEGYGKEGGRVAIRIIMNCLGGDEYQGMAVYDTIRQSKFETIVEGRGAVMSMGVFIMQAADQRLLSANARLMVHSGTWGDAGEQHFENHMRAAEEGLKLKDIYLEVLWKKIKERKPKFSREKMEELLKFDKFLSAREAISYGLADYVIKPAQK